MKDQEIRLEAIKVAAKVADSSSGVANILIHAQWITDFILLGRMPELDAQNS